MDELLLTNPGWSKVTPYKERSWPTGQLRCENGHPALIATNVIASKRMRVGRDVSMSADVQKIAQPGIGGQEQTTQEFIEEFSCANQQIRTGSIMGPTGRISMWRQDMHPLELPAINLSIISKNSTQ